MLDIKWLRKKLSKDIKEIEVIQKDREDALQELMRLSLLSKKLNK